MGSKTVVRAFLAAFAVAAFVACGGDGPTDPNNQNPQDTTTTPTDTAAANAAARTKATNTLLTQINDALAAMNRSGSVGGAGGSSGSNAGGAVAREVATLASDQPDANAAACTFDEANVRWSCPDTPGLNNTVIKSWFQFLDSDNQPHKQLDTNTASMRRFVGKSGVFTSQIGTKDGPVPVTDTMANTDTLLLSGLKGDPANRKVIARGTLHNVMVPDDATKPVIHMDGTTTTENFAFAPPTADGKPPAIRYPISGVLTVHLTTFQEGVANSTANTIQTTTYDGTAIAKLVVTTQQGKVILTCTYDMTDPNSPANCVSTPGGPPPA